MEQAKEDIMDSKDDLASIASADKNHKDLFPEHNSLFEEVKKESNRFSRSFNSKREQPPKLNENGIIYYQISEEQHWKHKNNFDNSITLYHKDTPAHSFDLKIDPVYY